MARYGAERKEQTRSRVLAEAARALREDGPTKLGVAEVMSRAGLTHGGFYAHFQSKEDLLAAATHSAFDDARTKFDAALDGLEPRAALQAYIDRYLSADHRDGRAEGCPLPALASEHPRMGDPAREVYAAGVRRATARIGRLLAAAGIENAEAAAPSVLAELVGAISLARASSNADEADQLLAACRAALKVRLGLRTIT